MVRITAPKKNERLVERLRDNGIVSDTCLISYEYNGIDYTVVTWYDVNEAYSFRNKEKDVDFKTLSEARREVRKRSVNWEKKFKSI